MSMSTADGRGGLSLCGTTCDDECMLRRTQLVQRLA